MQRSFCTFLREIRRPSHFPRLLLSTPAPRLSTIPSRSTPILSRTAHLPRIALSAQTQRYTSTLRSMDGQHNGETRVKRKEAPNSVQDRPLKQLRSDASAEENTNGFAHDDEEVDAQPVVHSATTDSVEWQRTIETVVSKVVSIHFCQTSAFDTDPALSSEATGFVVDAENGYILTNRVSWHLQTTMRPS